MSRPLHKHPSSNLIELEQKSASDHNTASDFDQTDLGHSKTRKQTIFGKIQTRLVGWRSGAINFSLIAVVVFLTNLIVTIYGIRSHPSNQGVLFEGDCSSVKNYNMGLHVLINIISTILVSGSNYCMQCLCAPNRREVDRAHAQGKWLDVGIPSFRNLRSVSRRRGILWFLLGVTSIPLHLFYNSAVFGSLASHSYFALSVSESFIHSAECLNCTSRMTSRYASGDTSAVDPYTDAVSEVLMTLHQEAHDGKLDRLEAAECIQQYAKTIQSERRNLLLVAQDHNFPGPANNTYIKGSMVYWAGRFYAGQAVATSEWADSSFDWICSGLGESNVSCAVSAEQIENAPETWRVGRAKYPVEYCLSQKAQPRCKLQFIPMILVIVTALNLIKAMLMLCAVLFTHESPLITIGDAVASFLETEDLTTKNMCLLSLQDIRKKGYQAGSRVWNKDRFRWIDVANRISIVITVTLFLAMIAAVAVLFRLALIKLPASLRNNLPALAHLGFGALDGRLIINGTNGASVVLSAVIGNMPQVLLSFLYLSYNALFTAMLGGVEWASYASKRKGLRVSRRPVGAQRSTYFLQLPYRYGVPLVVLSGVLHWSVSQSIFLAAVDTYDSNGAPQRMYFLNKPGITTCGFSPIAILSSMIIGVVMLVAIIAFGFVPYQRGMTLVGNCSMAISVACHPGEHVDGSIVATQKVKWGVLADSDEGIGHCTFSAEEVEPPIVGHMYAGKLRDS